MTPYAPSLERLGETYALATPFRDKRMLVIVNPYATTMSVRLKQLVVYALRGRYEVEAVDTESRGHATEICREAAHEGYDVVVAFGGDGTVNEAANGLVGSPTPLTCLPGGATNVYCRILGIPNDVVDATEHLLRLADDWRPRRVDVGSVNGRVFTFAAGVGLDATVVQRVDAHPRLKARYGGWYYGQAAVSEFTRRFLIHPPRLAVRLGDRTLSGVSAFVQVADPYTFFRDRPIRPVEGVRPDSAGLAGAVLERANALDVPTVAWRALSQRARLADHRRVSTFADARRFRIESFDARALPVQADGDFVEETEQAEFAVLPGALHVVG